MEILKDQEIDSIKPYSRNPRKNEKAVKEVMKSIQNVGYRTPVIVDENMEILVGHTRWKAMKELGHKTLNIIQYRDLTKEQKDDYRILDNKTGEVAEWDFDILLEDFDKDHLLDLGFDIKDLPMDEVVEDEAPPVPEMPKTVKGDLYELGNHRLLCGDSTIITDIEKLMDGHRADMVFTDPPYGVSVVKDGKVGADFGIAKKGQYAPIINDDTPKTANDFYNTCQSLGFKDYIIWGGNYFTHFLPPSKSWIIWNKRGDTMIRNTFADGEMAWTNQDKPLRIYSQLWNGMIRQGESGKRVHPTQKPVKMLGEITIDFSKENEIIFDGFLGSGSTLIACEQTNRKCYGMELDEKYCDVIVQRYVNFTKNTKIKLNGKDIEWPANSEEKAKNA